MGKQLLIENYTVKNSEAKIIPLTESSLMIEGAEYKCTAAYTFPISRPDKKNLNDRIYESLLWEGVIKRKEGENAFGLCDHPSGEGSVKDAFCVWHNVRFNEDRSLVIADAYLFGKWGLQAKQALEAGGALGMSSVGYGEFKQDGSTIDEKTYELRRPADWVMNPSYEVFGKEQDAITAESVKPSSEDNSSTEVENISEDIMNTKKTKLEEHVFRVQMEGMVKDIKNSDDLKFKITESKKAISFLDDGEFFPELKEELEGIISESETTLHDLADKGSQLDETVTQKSEAEELVKTLTEEKEKLELEKADLEKVAMEATELSDSMKVVVQESTDKIAELENKLQTSFTAEEVLALKDKYAEDIKAVTENTFSTEEVAKLQEEMATLMAENAELKAEAEKEKDDKKKDDEDGDDEDGDDMDDKDEKKKKDKKENVEVVAYYNKMRDAYPAVVKIKEEILGCKTLIEAQKKFINLKSVVTESSYKASYMLPEKPETELSENVLGRKLVRPTNNLKLREGWS